MSGLNPDQDRILEIATLITDGNLQLVAEGPELIIHQQDHLLNNMDEWNTTHHGESGLTEKVRLSKLSESEAEQQTLRFIQHHVAAGSAPLAGNSIHQDRRFLAQYMPELEAHFHYRNVDVSTVKELVRRWQPATYASAPPKKGNHRALDDIRASIAELQFYRQEAFK